MSRTTPYYKYDPNLGNPRDHFTSADVVHPEFHQPEVPGLINAVVEGETIINTMHGVQNVAFRTEPGAPCIIVGYWEDGTVQVRWAAIAGYYNIDGRFPGWVVSPDHAARMAGGGRILPANDPVVRRRTVFHPTLLVFALIVLATLVVALWWYLEH